MENGAMTQTRTHTQTALKRHKEMHEVKEEREGEREKGDVYETREPLAWSWAEKSRLMRGSHWLFSDIFAGHSNHTQWSNLNSSLSYCRYREIGDDECQNVEWLKRKSSPKESRIR